MHTHTRMKEEEKKHNDENVKKPKKSRVSGCNIARIDTQRNAAHNKICEMKSKKCIIDVSFSFYNLFLVLFCTAVQVKAFHEYK